MKESMVCHECGAKLEKLITNLPFKLGSGSIVIIKGLPVLQCRNCSEYMIEDEVMQNVDKILNKIDKTAELEVLRYAVQGKAPSLGRATGRNTSKSAEV